MDADSHSPVFMGSAFMQSSVHPCKIGPHLEPPSACRVPYGGHEYAHHGRYDLLPFMRDRMEFVPTSHGRIPLGRQPVKGGFECAGQRLYHAAAVVHGIKIPGKTGIHLAVAMSAMGVKNIKYKRTMKYCAGSSRRKLLREQAIALISLGLTIWFMIGRHIS
ncbi:hypothetical protein BGW80DRAFT_1206923 [Lactifluus volemus]|nr:hypothetical protein BGW80DRAFT_1206923 [Lactifluus volemus]